MASHTTTIATHVPSIVLSIQITRSNQLFDITKVIIDHVSEIDVHIEKIETVWHYVKKLLSRMKCNGEIFLKV